MRHNIERLKFEPIDQVEIENMTSEIDTSSSSSECTSVEEMVLEESSDSISVSIESDSEDSKEESIKPKKNC